jgi:hypothetical protein
MSADTLRVVIIKPSKYDDRGRVERFRRGFMPNSTLPFLRSMTPIEFEGASLEVVGIDEYVQTDLGYLDLLRKGNCPTLLALAGVQSHQFHRALDLAALARSRGVEHCVIGGPHPMTCDTTLLQGRGVSFALAEAELVWPAILRAAMGGGLQPVYGERQRWQQTLDPPALIPPSPGDGHRYLVPMLGIYPARGCPFTCNFCSVIKIAGRRVRSQAIDSTLQSLRAAQRAGVKLIMFTSDNFNKYPEAAELLRAMIQAKLTLPFFVQCDTQIVRDEGLVELLGRAGCCQMFVGVESFDRATLVGARKFQNKPAHYGEIVRLCTEYGISTHFSNIIGFPEQDEAGILDHLSTLRKMRPLVASFYILTPIPGTEQYDEFRTKGLITEMNLDRFDTSCLVWRHPLLSNSQLKDLMYRCYREFFALPDIVTKALNRKWKDIRLSIQALAFGYSLFCRVAAHRRMHPMSGGIGRVSLDGASDYSELRRKRFGFDLLPLPASLSTPIDRGVDKPEASAFLAGARASGGPALNPAAL